MQPEFTNILLPLADITQNIKREYLTLMNL